jgi:hypothetical protein
MIRTHLLAILTTTVLITLPAPAEAQFGRGESTIVRNGSGLPDVPGGFTFCRLQYRSGRLDGSGNGWAIDFPRGDRHIMLRLSELTPTMISRWSHGEPGFTVVRVTDTELFSCPFLMASDVGELELTPEEADRMREYLLRGGFFWADDFWGSSAWGYFEREMQKVFPEASFVELTPDHPLFDIAYQVPRVPQIPNLNSWRGPQGGTSEMGADSEHAGLYAIYDESGRIMVLASHNTDIQDGWEREADDPGYFALFSPDGYAVGINILIWMMTH